MRELSIVAPLHRSTKREYPMQTVDEQVACMLKAKEYEYDYWDGDRKYGYGGYKYDGRWVSVAHKLIKTYRLTPTSRILDVGCGMAHLLYELKRILVCGTYIGFDRSKYARDHAPEDVQKCICTLNIDERYPFPDKYFDLVISLMTLHNLNHPQLEVAITEIERVGKKKYIYHESFTNEREQVLLQRWAKTAATEIDKDSWIWLYNKLGYTGDYEFAYFE